MLKTRDALAAQLDQSLRAAVSDGSNRVVIGVDDLDQIVRIIRKGEAMTDQSQEFRLDDFMDASRNYYAAKMASDDAISNYADATLLARLDRERFYSANEIEAVAARALFAEIALQQYMRLVLETVTAHQGNGIEDDTAAIMRTQQEQFRLTLQAAKETKGGTQ